MKTVTLNQIKNEHHCRDEYEILIKALNKTKADDEAIELTFILEANGLDGALWILTNCFEYKEYCLFLADVAESVLSIYEKTYPEDTRVKDCIQAMRDYHAGIITKEQLENADSAADDAATDAEAASDVAWSVTNAARSVANYAALAAAGAAWNAARTVSAVRDSAWGAWGASAEDDKKKEIEQLFIKHFGE